MATNLSGSIDLLKLDKSGIVTIKGKKCLVVLLEGNDFYVTSDPTTGKAKSCYLGLSVYERKEESQYGKTHYCKQSLSKEFRESNTKEVIDAKNNVYLGDFKTFTFEGGNQAETVSAPVVEEVDEDLPF